MDFPMRAALRPLFATAAAVLLATACAGAATAQDQDGPASPQGGYQGPMLNWAGKAPSRVAPPAAPPRSEMSYAPSPRYMAPASPPSVAEPPPESAPPPPRMVRANPEPPPPAMAAPAPQPAPAPVAAPAPAVAESGHTGPRFYSLHRAYGITPDPIPIPTERSTVLVGPPDRGADPGADAAGADDPPAKPAPHGDGQGADGADDQSGEN
jgi:hypothetical protein